MRGLATPNLLVYLVSFNQFYSNSIGSKMFHLKPILKAFFAKWERKLSILSLIFCFIIIMKIYSKTLKEPKIYQCYLDAEYANEDQSILRDVLLSEEKPMPGQTIFFIETKCQCSASKYNILNFTAHQACAFESAALHHSTYDVYVLVACQSTRHQNDPILDAVLSYKNVKLRYVNLWRFAEGSPIEEWLKNESLFRSKYLIVNISDLLRLLSLYRYGGIYLDEDVIMFRSLQDESPNFMGAETKKSIGNSVIGLESTGYGHQIADILLKDFQRNYMGNIWGHNGPMLLVRMMSLICGTNDVNLMRQDGDRCHGIKVLDINAFYEINWLERSHFFDEKHANETLKRLKNSYAMHTWNHVKTDWPFSVDSNSAYIQLVAQHCPRVFAATGKYFT